MTVLIDPVCILCLISVHKSNSNRWRLGCDSQGPKILGILSLINSCIPDVVVNHYKLQDIIDWSFVRLTSNRVILVEV